MENVKNGTILVKLCKAIFGIDIPGTHQNPSSYANFVSNISRCLDFLKKQPRMSKKFLWKVREIVDGNEMVILGVLEDLNRFSDGLPEKKDPNYFQSGPYLTLQN